MFLAPSRLALLVVPLALSFVPAAARGNLVLTAEPLTLTSSAPGSTGRITIQVASSDGTDVLDAFGAEFRLTSMSGHFLSFVNPPTDLQLGDPDYLFHGDSVSELVGPPAGAVSTVDHPDDTSIGGDGTVSGSGIAVPAVGSLASPKILLVLEVVVPAGSGVEAGDLFHLTLVRGLSTFFLGPIPSDGDPLSLVAEFEDVPIQIAAAPIPEPATIVAAGTGLILGLGVLACRRRSVSQDNGAGSGTLLG